MGKSIHPTFDAYIYRTIGGYFLLQIIVFNDVVGHVGKFEADIFESLSSVMR